MAITNLQNVQDKHINRYLTELLVRYQVEGDVSDFISPPFKTPQRSNKYLIYGKENFQVIDNKIGRRNPVKEVNPEFKEDTFVCQEYGLGGFVYERDIQSVDNPLDLKAEVTRQVKLSQSLQRAYRVTSFATNTALVQNTTASATYDANPTTATPIADLRNAIYQVHKGSGKTANAVTMTLQTALALIGTTEWKDYFKYTVTGFGQGLWSVIEGLKNLGLEARIAGVFGTSSQDGTSSDPQWDYLLGRNILVFHREPAPSIFTNTFSFSPYTVKDEVREYWVDRERGWEIQVVEEIVELMVNKYCGYLITTCTAN